jgi:hypothetical protein
MDHVEPPETPRLNPMLPQTPSAVQMMTDRRSTKIVTARESSVIHVPLMDSMTRETFELQLATDSADPLRQLDSPSRKQVLEHLKKLQLQLNVVVNQYDQ